MRRWIAIAFLSLTGCGGAAAETGPKEVLPLKTLRLYESGVGYFERSGELSHDSSMSLPVPAGHLDDALKTLVVIGKDGRSSVQAVEFSSSVGRAMARALAGLPKDADAPIAYKDLLLSMRGANVAVVARQNQNELRGRVIDVAADDPKPATDDAKTAQNKPIEDTFTLLLLADDGSVRRVRTADITSVRPLDAAFATRLDAALDALAPHGAQDRALEVLAHSSGPITLGYIAETPVYRTTYRLVFADDAKSGGVLQGWALIHNDTDESWRHVKVDLVNGRPDSFLFPMAAPRYERRELVAPERSLSTVPQLLDKTADGIWGDNLEDGIGVGGIGTVGYGEGGGGSGFGAGHGRLSGSASGSSVEESSVLGVGNLASVADATGVEAGALFVYSLGEPLDLHAHSSALLPFLSRTLDVTEITWVDDFEASPRAAARIVNDSPQTIPPGPIAFFSRGGFSGESKIDRMKPGERAFVSYGAELDLGLTREDVTSGELPKHVAFQNDALVEHFLKTTSWTYEIENKSGRAKSVYAALPIVSNATVNGADKLDYDPAEGKPVAVLEAPPSKKLERKMQVVEGLSRSTRASDLKADALEKLANELGAVEGALVAEIAKKQKELEATEAKTATAEADIKTVDEDLKRWRENLKAAGGERGASAALVTRVVQLEDKLTALRKQLETLQAEEKTKSLAVHTALEKLPSS